MRKFVTLILFGGVLSSILFSCKKELTYIETSNPTVKLRKDKNFPSGVLEFNSENNFITYYKKAISGKDVSSNLPSEFKSFSKIFNDFQKEIYLRQNNLSTGVTQNVDSTEFLLDEKSIANDDDYMQMFLNSDMQIIIQGKLYQYTRIGEFIVPVNSITDFINLFNIEKEKIYFDENYDKTPNEISLGNHEFNLLGDVIRKEKSEVDVFEQDYPYPNTDPGGGGGPIGYGGPSGLSWTTGTVNTRFNSENNQRYDDRLFSFKTHNIDLFIYHTIYIKGKLQKQKKFLWFTYWGPSFADEIIVGCDNMSISSSYIFPHYHQFSDIFKPEFGGLADFQIGDVLLKTANVNVNLTALNYSLTNSQVSSFIDNTFNSVVGNVYQSIYQEIEDKLINDADPNFKTKYANYTTQINDLNEEFRFKFRIGKAKKPQGYSHKNIWVFDYNVGYGTDPNTHYSYEMKAGTFWGIARVGSHWFAIRTVVTP